MRPTCTVDLSGLRGRLRDAEAARLEARRVGTLAGAAIFIGHVATHGRRDTNRYVASVVSAGHDVGVTQFPVPAIVPSRDRERYVDRLQDQAAFWRDRAEQIDAGIRAIEAKLKLWFDDRGRKRGKGAKKMERQVAAMRKKSEKAWRYAGRAAEEIYKVLGDKTALVIYGSGGRVNDKGRRVGYRLHTARVGVYGGRGTLTHSGSRTVVEIRSMEPHARIVEKRYRTFSNALAAAQGSTGVRRMSRAYTSVVAGKQGYGKRSA